MLAFKGLSVVLVVLTASRVTDVPDGSRTNQLLHDRFMLAAVREPENFANGSDIFVGFEQQRSLGVKARHASCKLPTILDVLKHPWKQIRSRLNADSAAERAFGGGWKVVDSSYPTLVIQFTHTQAFYRNDEPNPEGSSV
jgi:hypothetical protein